MLYTFHENRIVKHIKIVLNGEVRVIEEEHMMNGHNIHVQNYHNKLLYNLKINKVNKSREKHCQRTKINVLKLYLLLLLCSRAYVVKESFNFKHCNLTHSSWKTLS
jgi:hypothetical protein